MDSKITEIFYLVDEFCKEFYNTPHNLDNKLNDNFK